MDTNVLHIYEPYELEELNFNIQEYDEVVIFCDVIANNLVIENVSSVSLLGDTIDLKDGLEITNVDVLELKSCTVRACQYITLTRVKQVNLDYTSLHSSKLVFHSISVINCLDTKELVTLVEDVTFSNVSSILGKNNLKLSALRYESFGSCEKLSPLLSNFNNEFIHFNVNTVIYNTLADKDFIIARFGKDVPLNKSLRHRLRSAKTICVVGDMLLTSSFHFTGRLIVLGKLTIKGTHTLTHINADSIVILDRAEIDCPSIYCKKEIDIEGKVTFKRLSSVAVPRLNVKCLQPNKLEDDKYIYDNV